MRGVSSRQPVGIHIDAAAAQAVEDLRLALVDENVLKKRIDRMKRGPHRDTDMWRTEDQLSKASMGVLHARTTLDQALLGDDL